MTGCFLGGVGCCDGFDVGFVGYVTGRCELNGVFGRERAIKVEERKRLLVIVFGEVQRMG